jgi:hypothetical protein
MATVAQYAPHVSVHGVSPGDVPTPEGRVVRGPELIPPATLVLQREGNTVTATATSLRGGVVYYHWYIDGAYVATTITNVWSFTLEVGERVRVAVIDTNDASFDPVANAPEGFPARRTLRWVRSPDASIDYYDLELKKDAGAWTAFGRVAHDERRWSYSLRTPVLEDLAVYLWKVTAWDIDGNPAGSGSIWGGSTIVRTPDAPQFEIDYDSGTGKVTFSEAA